MLSLVPFVEKAKSMEFGWAESGKIEIAYQVSGSGTIDLILVPSYLSHLEQVWELPANARFLRSLGSFCRLIIFDKRGHLLRTGGKSQQVEGQAPDECPPIRQG